MRILAVDHGEKRIGLALSDPTATIASPFKVIEHVSRTIDAAQVANLASENEVGLIVIGQSFDEEGSPNLAGRRAAKFARGGESDREHGAKSKSSGGCQSCCRRNGARCGYACRASRRSKIQS